MTKQACVVVERDTGAESAAGASLARKVLAAWDIRQRLEAAQAEMDAANAALSGLIGPGRSVVVAGVCRVTVAERESVSIPDPARLAAVLGADRFGDLTRTAVTVRPERRLLEMAADGDEPLAPAIRECLKVGASVTVTWRTERGAP